MTEKSVERKTRVAGRIKSVEVGYRVLLAVQLGPGSVRLSDVARRSGLSTGAAHNYLVSLMNTGLVEQDGRGRYRLGPSAFALSLASFRQLNGYDVLRDEANALQQLTKQTTSVAVWSQAGPVSIYLQRGDAKHPPGYRPGLFPLLNSGAGQVFMAHLPKRQIIPIVVRELEERGLDAKAEDILASTRAAVVEKGYAFVHNEESNSDTLAAPVWVENKRVPFVLSLIMYGSVPPDVREKWLNELLACSQRASLLIDPDFSERN